VEQNDYSKRMMVLNLLGNILGKYAKIKEYVELRGIVDLLINISSNRRSFLISQKEFESFLNSYDFKNTKIKIEGERCGIVVTPWMGTAVPWFAVTVALLYRQNGLNSCLIWDDLLFYDEEATNTENKAISEILVRLDGLIEVIKLSEVAECKLDSDDINEIKRLAALNSVHDFISSIPTIKSTNYQNLIANSLQNNLSKIKSLFKIYNFHHLVVPGGICGNSGLFYWAGGLFNTRVASYDAGSGVALIGSDDVAAHQMDIPKLVKQDNIFNSESEKKTALELARQEFALRMKGNDKFSSQHVPQSLAGTEMYFDILIPLNIDWDSAALGKHRFFDRTYQWLTETINFILERTTATIAVRQHPAEKSFKSGIYLEEYFNRLFADNPRCKFFPCYEKVNTYDLLNNVSLVLPFTSTVGVEAAMLGKQIVVESDCYYSDLPFVQKAISKHDYFNKILKCLDGKNIVDAKMIENAELCYYFTQVGNWVFTDFTPNNTNFQKWSNSSFSELLNDETVQDIIMSFSKGIPMALLRSKRMLENQEAK
jgi:hypothetical protein